MKLLRIPNVIFDAKDRLYTRYLHSSKTEQNRTTMGQFFSYIQTSKKLRIQLGLRY